MKGCIVEKKNSKGKKKYHIVVDLPKKEGAKRKQKWFSSWNSYRDAENALPNILLEVRGYSYESSNNLPFKQVIEDYLISSENELAKSTYKRYTSCCNLIKEELGHIPIKKIEPCMIQDYFKLLKNKKKFSTATIQKHKSVLQQIFQYAIELRIIDHSPVPKLRIATNHAETEHDTWSSEQIRMFLNCVKGEPIYIPVLLAGTTGMREGEIVGLKWKDIDFQNNTLSVLRSKDFDNTLKVPKTKSSKRKIHLMDWVVEELKKHQTSQKSKRLKYGKKYVVSDFVCTLDNGKPLSTNYVTKTFPRKVTQNNFSKIRFHDLRHSFATISLANGIHAKVVQEILGHSSIQVTLNTYSHVIPTVHSESMDKLTKAFS